METLVISRNRFYAEGVTHLARFFNEQTGLKHIDVSSNNINIGSGADEPEESKADGNSLGDTGGFNDMFPSLAKSAQSLEYLSISENNICTLYQIAKHREQIENKEGIT
jgi:hypothetical protein